MTDYDWMTPAQMLRELKRKDAVIERQAAELEEERSLWTDRDARERRHGNPDLASRKESLARTIASPKRLRAATGCSKGEFRCILFFLAQYVPADERLMPLFRIEGGGRASDPGNRCALEPQYALLLVLMRLKTNMRQGALACMFGTGQGTISRYLEDLEEVLAAVLPTADAVSGTIVSGRIDPERVVPGGELLADCTEVPVQRPGDPEMQSATYPGHRGTSTYTTMIGVARRGRIIAYLGGSYAGSDNDNGVSGKDADDLSRLTSAVPGATLCMDKGFDGAKYHVDAGVTVRVPRKKPRGGRLTAADRARNLGLSRERIPVEHVIADIKEYERVRGRYDSDIETFRRELCVITGLASLHRMWKRLGRMVRRGGPPPHWSAYFG